MTSPQSNKICHGNCSNGEIRLLDYYQYMLFMLTLCYFTKGEPGEKGEQGQPGPPGIIVSHLFNS